jgi:hypothetical protein
MRPIERLSFEWRAFLSNTNHEEAIHCLCCTREVKRHGVTYDGLVEKLAEIGVDDTAVNIRNKVARGGFTAVFLVQCLEAMGVRDLRLS